MISTSIALALIACICAATAIGQLAKLWPSAGGMYTYVAGSLGAGWGFLVAWLVAFAVVRAECFARLRRWHSSSRSSAAPRSPIPSA